MNRKGVFSDSDWKPKLAVKFGCEPMNGRTAELMKGRKYGLIHLWRWLSNAIKIHFKISFGYRSQIVYRYLYFYIR